MPTQQVLLRCAYRCIAEALCCELTTDSPSEKPARAALFTAATRSLNPSTITILDSANYIKGFRYQLYCAAREAGVRVATVHPVAPPNKCKGWEEERGKLYKPET